MVDCVLQYLKATLERGLLFKRGKSLYMKSYTDADYSSSYDKRYNSNYYTFLSGGVRSKM